MSPNDAVETVVCHVRAPLLLEPVDTQVETLQVCESDGTIDDLLVRSWPKEVALDEDSPYQEALDAYERLSSWADARGVSVEPPFRRRTTTSQVTGRERDLLVTPLLCLELYANDELVGVFPHTDGDETVTTEDAIATLRTGEVPTPLSGDGTEREDEFAVDGATCPDCGGSLVDGQGLFACADCGWTGTIRESGQYAARRNRGHTDPLESVELTR